MREFKDALKQERKYRGLTQAQLANKIGVSSQVVSNWERGYTTSLSPDMLNSIAKALNTTPEVFLGLQKVTKNNSSNFRITQESFDFIPRLRSIMDEKNISMEELMDRSGYDQDEISAFFWENKMPTIEDLIRLSIAVGVSSDYLLDLSQRKNLSAEDELLLQTITDRERELLRVYRELDGDNQDIIMGDAKKALKEQILYGSLEPDPNRTENVYPSSGTEGSTKKGA